MRSLLWGEVIYLHVGAEKAAFSKYNIWRGFSLLHRIKTEQQIRWLRQYKTLTNSALNHSEVKEPGLLWFRKFPATLCPVWYQCQPKAGSEFQCHLPTAANSSHDSWEGHRAVWWPRSGHVDREVARAHWLRLVFQSQVLQEVAGLLCRFGHREHSWRRDCQQTLGQQLKSHHCVL